MVGADLQKEMLKLWKSSWEAYLKTIQAMSDQGSKMLELMLGQSDQLSDEFKKSLKEWSANAKSLQDQYVQSVEENIKKMEDMLGK